MKIEAVEDAKKEFLKNAYELQDCFEEKHRGHSEIPEKFGLCASCNLFSYAASQYGHEYAKCDCHEMSHWPIAAGRIEKCSRYEKLGQMSLREMCEIAYYINPDKKKTGF